MHLDFDFTVATHVMSFLFFSNDTATTEIYTLSYTTLFRSGARPEHQRDALGREDVGLSAVPVRLPRSEEHTSELQSQFHLVCRLLLEKKKNRNTRAGAIARADSRSSHYRCGELP